MTSLRNSRRVGSSAVPVAACLWFGLGLPIGPGGGAASSGVEMLAAAVASITAEDASRHVAALADDALEGREGGTRGGRAAAAYIVEQIESLGFEPAGDAGSYYQPFGTGLRNILALLPGRDPELAHEVVVIGAHYDHVGYGNSETSFGPFGFVHNGADDNASGVAGLIEIMKALGRLSERPQRSILIAFWDGEEKGLLGSSHFLRVRPGPLAGRPIVFSLNLDMIGRLRDNRVIVYGARTASGLRSRLATTNSNPANGAALQLAFDWDILEDSDHYPFIATGIPTLMLHTGLHDQYHRPSDDVELVNVAGIPLVSRLALALIREQADAPQPLAFRSASRAESNATRRRLEEARPPSGPSQGRWGIVSRADPGEPGAPIIVDVARGSPAERAGLRAGDRLHQIDGQLFADPAAMVERLRTAGESCRLMIERRGRMREVTLEAVGN
ncbi:MAG: M20/M25/M40 family metallo-hydrolase [Planctomycetota bacterium]